ncbi:MAG: trypsin-like peptidase domain-containing protein [Burkholderiaceae bacterium]|jgi:Do/DeqQ family serine protease|nr:trypsin-like peptidase domain-containing protein [Burkholderiaceae bacterium]
MKRFWLLFAQTVTVLLAAWFVVRTLQPGWLGVPSAERTAISVVEASGTPSAAAAPGSLNGAVRKAAPAVVSINTRTTAASRPVYRDPWFRFFFGDFGEQTQQEQAGLGSGVIVSTDGYVLTNNHVIENADQIEVILADTRHATAEIVGTDPDSDLAVLKISIVGKLPVMTLGDSSALQVGDPVLAIGNPFGVGQTVTSGIVSALGRELGPDRLGTNTFEHFIQTDAAINPGNSGGALTDTAGNLIGINTAIYSNSGSGGSIGIGFAIPVSTARQVLEGIVKNGQVSRVWIGIEARELASELARNFGIRAPAGVIVTGVNLDGPAAAAGIRPGDVITQIEGQPVRTVPELMTRIAALPPGTAARFTLERGGESERISVTPREHRRLPPVGRQR